MLLHCTRFAAGLLSTRIVPHCWYHPLQSISIHSGPCPVQCGALEWYDDTAHAIYTLLHLVSQCCSGLHIDTL